MPKSNKSIRQRRTVVLRAHAKVNLHLDVGPARADGYHNLKTLFQEISLSDKLIFTPDDRITMTVVPQGLPVNSDNLVIRALLKLQLALRIKKGIHVRLEKRIPVGAGLGGGSSDAAAALIGGWTIWKGKAPQPKNPLLMRIAKTLGADVPFFLLGGTAWGAGVGEKLTPLPMCPKRWLVLVYPRVQVSTRLAYKLLDRARIKRVSTNGHQHFSAKDIPGNSFEQVILPRFSAIKLAKRELEKMGCTGVMMSGSGSSVFGFVANKQEADRVLKKLRKKPWDVFVAHTL